MPSTTEAVQKTQTTDFGCPPWCEAEHLAEETCEQPSLEIRMGKRHHFGHSTQMEGMGVDFGAPEAIAQAELFRIDNLATGDVSEIGVTAWCDAIMTIEQAERFAQIILLTARKAREITGRRREDVVVPEGWTRRLRMRDGD